MVQKRRCKGKRTKEGGTMGTKSITLKKKKKRNVVETKMKLSNHSGDRAKEQDRQALKNGPIRGGNWGQGKGR